MLGLLLGNKKGAKHLMFVNNIRLKMSTMAVLRAFSGHFYMPIAIMSLKMLNELYFLLFVESLIVVQSNSRFIIVNIK